MKRFLILFILVIVVGCKSNKDKLICNYSDNLKKDTVTIYFKNNKSVSYDKESRIILESSSDAINYKLDDNYDNIEVVDKVVSMYVSESLDDLTKQEVKSLYEKMGYKCK